jgi:hypothetical protein
MANRNQDRPPLSTPQDVEEEITRRIEGEAGLFPSGVTAERKEQIRAEVEDLFEATQHADERNAEMEVWKQRAAEDIPFVETFEEAIRHFGGEDLLSLDAIDDYVKLDDKNQLVDTPFIVVKFWFSTGEILDEATGEVRETVYATAQLITADSRKFTITDGSTGVRKQLQKWYERTGRWGGVPARSGLRVSRYPNPTNRKLLAETFYLT